MEERPKLKVVLTKSDKAVEVISWILLLSIWALTLTGYSKMPEIIPTHYNASGDADGFGQKVTIFLLPVIATILFIGLTIANKYPHTFNYMTSVTNENALTQYSNATRMMRYLKTIVLFIFGTIVFKTIQNTNGNADGLGVWFLPLTMGLIFIPTLYFIVKSFRSKS
jgi:uncharacterized membrane protein